MKGILSVILPEEPDLEGNISELEEKYFPGMYIPHQKTSGTCTSPQAS